MAYDPNPQASAVDPAAIAGRTFTANRRGGYDPDEVNRFLATVAAELERSLERERALELRINDLERELYDAQERASQAASAHPLSYSLADLDEVQITGLVGEETAKVLAAARQAAAEIRANAEQTASEMRGKSARDADRVIRQADALLEQRARDADEEAARTLQDAETAIAQARTELAEELEAGRVDAARQARDLVRQAEETVAAAGVEAGRIAAEAHAQAEADVTAARDEASVLVSEAQRIREELLQDLLRRRKQLRRQVEQLHAGRDRLVDAFVSVRDTMGHIQRELDVALPEAKRAAEDAAARADDAPDEDAQLVADLLPPPPEPEAEAESEPTADAGEDHADASTLFSRLRADTGEAPVATIPEAEPPSEPEPESEPATDDEPTELDRRDERLAELTKATVRKLKRALSDEQNGLLDTIRRASGVPTLDELLGTAAEQEERLIAVGEPSLQAAVDAGVAFPGPTTIITSPAPTAGDLATALAVGVAGPLRSRLADRGPAESAGDDLVATVRQAYREVRDRVVDEVAAVAVRVAFGRGVRASSADPDRVAALLVGLPTE